MSVIRVQAKTQAKSAIIFLHGLGDSGEGWSWLPQVVELANIIKDPETINYVFPNAPLVPITVNNGFPMPGWFDIYQFGPGPKEDAQGFLKTYNYVRDLIKEQIEKHNVPAERIIVGGFSQGAAISLATAALLDFKIGGFVALSGFCPATKYVTQECKGQNFETPIFQGHGDLDNVVPFAYGQHSGDFYKKLGFTDLTFNTYKGVAHSADDVELRDMVKFINDVLSK